MQSGLLDAEGETAQNRKHPLEIFWRTELEMSKNNRLITILRHRLLHKESIIMSVNNIWKIVQPP